MTDSLQRLNELVRQTEVKSKAQRIHVEMRNATDRFRVAAERAQVAERRLRETRPVRLKELEQADTEEQQLKELIKKVAVVKNLMESDNDAEELIAAAQRDIEIKRREAREDLESATREAEESRRELKEALESYTQLRADLDQVQPQLAERLAAEDRLAVEAQMLFPGGQLAALNKEIEDGIHHFGLLEPREQYAQLKIWIGRYRRLQTYNLSEEEQLLSRRIFGKLVGLSKEYEPGYIEAFQINFTCDWDQFIAEAQEQLKQASEFSRRRREMQRQHEEYQSRELERQRMARESGQSALDELKSVLLRYNLPNEGAEEFRDVLNRVIGGLGASDPRVLDLVMPFRDLIDGWSEFRALRRNLDRQRDEDEGSEAGLQEQVEDLLSVTRGMRVLMIGGVSREDVRRSLERVFEFDKLEWETYEDTKPALLESLEQRVRNRGMDLLLILKSFIRHHVPEKMRPLCEQHSIPCLMVEHGYGPAQIADTLRRGLLKTV
jgi:hypothetical protein